MNQPKQYLRHPLIGGLAAMALGIVLVLLDTAFTGTTGESGVLAWLGFLLVGAVLIFWLFLAGKYWRGR